MINYADNPTGFAPPALSYLRYPHQRYYDETPYTLTHYAPFEFMFRPGENFNSLSGSNYHIITVYYGTDFTDTTELKLKDLTVFKPVCYLANNRVRKCTIDTANNKITMSFQFALTANS